MTNVRLMVYCITMVHQCGFETRTLTGTDCHTLHSMHQCFIKALDDMNLWSEVCHKSKKPQGHTFYFPANAKIKTKPHLVTETPKLALFIRVRMCKSCLSRDAEENKNKRVDNIWPNCELRK